MKIWSTMLSTPQASSVDSQPSLSMFASKLALEGEYIVVKNYIVYFMYEDFVRRN